MLDIITTVKMDNFDEDEELIRAMEESLRHYKEVELAVRHIREDEVNHPAHPKNKAVTVAASAVPSTSRQTNSFSNIPNTTEEKSTWSIFKQPKDKKQPNGETIKVSANSGSTASKPGPSRSLCIDPQPSTSRSSGSPNWMQATGSNSGSIKNPTSPVCPQSNSANDVVEPMQLFSTEKTLTAEGFCKFTGRCWVYPTNYPERKYQLDMVQTALFHNTLVCLPTGLGKTFIAAVVMYNYYRWYPKGKIIFMAPTKPLVAQQIKACYEITGIPKDETEEMTGMTSSDRRTTAWKQKRVFFATPQVVANDLIANICPAEAVRCLVVDEAHRAQGQYAYCHVINNLRPYNTHFRVLALSATPGSDINAVKQVLQNLMISKLKIATEDSPDVAQYTHHREMEIIQVSPTSELNEARDRFLRLMDKYWQPLTQNSIVSGFNTANMTQFQVKTSMDKLLKNPPNWLSHTEVSRLQGFCLICITLCHAQELLQNYGLRSFISYIQGVLKDPNGNKLVVGYLSKDDDLLRLIEDLKERLGLQPEKNEQSGNVSKIIYGHPKLQKLQEIVMQHFVEYDDRNEQTKCIIFCQYRDSVEEIKNILKEYEPFIKPMSFVGQAKSKGCGGLTQKQQLEVMRDFRSGGYNTLISTCVGEEGLDIGEVDLIVCVDASKSPIRLVQRMGRTGRKRSGRIVMLLSEGKEHKKYIDSRNQQSRISKAILNSGKLMPILNQMTSPRMVPQDVNPQIHRAVLTIPKEMKNQDIRKLARKIANPPTGSSYPSAEELAEWDGEVPKYDYMEFKSKYLSFLPTGKVQNMLGGELEDADEVSRTIGLQLNNWLEWQRSFQGPNEAFHSSDLNILVEVLQLGDRMTLNNPTLLTQTADLVSEVDHDTLWNTRKNKGKGKGKKGRVIKEIPPGPRKGGIEWCLQQQSTKVKRPVPTIPFDPAEDSDIFVLPQVRELPSTSYQLPDKVQQALEQLSLLSNTKEIKPDNPFHRVFTSLPVFNNVILEKNKKPDLSLPPPDITELDTIFSDLLLDLDSVHVNRNNYCESSPPRVQETFNIEYTAPSQKSPILGKRKLTKSRQEPVDASKVTVQTSQVIQSDVPQVITIADTSSTEPKTSTSHDHNMDLSPGMDDYLMNFDIGIDDDLIAIIKDEDKVSTKENHIVKRNNSSPVKTKKEIGDRMEEKIGIKTETRLDVKSSPNVAVTPEVSGQIDFEVLDDDDDLFADVDISTWMGEFENQNNLTQQNSSSLTENKSEIIITPKTPQNQSIKQSILPSSKSPDVNSIANNSKVTCKSVIKTPITQIRNGNIYTPSSSSSSSIKSPSISAIDKLKANNKKALTSPLLFTGSSDDWVSPPLTTTNITKVEKKNEKNIDNKSPVEGYVFSPPKPTENVEKPKPKTSKLSITNRIASEMRDISKQKIESPPLHNIKEAELNKNKASMSDEDSIIFIKKKACGSAGVKGKAVFISSDEDEMPGIQGEPISVSSDTDEDHVQPVKVNKKKVPKELKKHDFSSDDDFFQPGSVQVKRKNLKEHEIIPKKAKKSRHGMEFLDVEAEVSGELESDEFDIESSQMDRYDESFINNFTQADPSVDMKARYLQSVKSPIHHGKYKIPDLVNKKVYKSPGAELEEDSCYMNDSFCVETEGSGDDCDSGHSSDEELDELEAKLEAKRLKKKKRSREITSSPESAVKNKGKKLKRIIMHISSDDESPTRNTTIKNAPSLETSIPLASSTPHPQVVKGFEKDYVDDDADLEALMAQITASQETELVKQANQASKHNKKPFSRSLFGNREEQDVQEVKLILNSTSAAGITKTKEDKNLSSAGSSRLYSEAGPSSRDDTVKNSQPHSINYVSLSRKAENMPESLPQSLKPQSKMASKLSVSKSIPTLSDPSVANQTNTSNNRLQLAQTAVVYPQNTTSNSNENRPEPSRPVNANSPSTSSTNMPESESNTPVPVIIASTRQITSAPKLIHLLRLTHGTNVVFKTLPAGVDYVISQRLAVGREQIGNVISCGVQSDFATTVRSLRQNFKFVVLVLENGNLRPVSEPCTSWEPQRHPLPGTRQLRIALCHLQRLNVKVVFTKDQAETANILHTLAVKENLNNFGIIYSFQNACDPVFEARLKFFTTLPGVNIALALKLAHQFPVIAHFINRCTTAAEVENFLNIDRRHALSVFKIIMQCL